MKIYFQQRQSQELSPDVVAEMSNQMRSLATALENLEAKGMEAGSNQQLLKKLHFKSISTRERRIEKAHQRTFQWLIDSDHQVTRPKSGMDLIKWFRNSDGVFWIYGKPGSGKSTFMKFIRTQGVVREHLEYWAEGHQLVTPSFYFWNSGSRLQKSLEGLLRTLLFEILRHDPSVILNINRDPKLASSLSYDEEWDVDTLFQMYEIAVLKQQKVKFCLFVDGLDEFQDVDYKALGDLTSALHRLETSDKIKLCVDSRPWTEFADIYGHSPSKSLKLEDLTRDDIHSYVSDAFHNHQQFAKLMEIDPNYEGLISEVVVRAQGVFLWVRLVVQILLDGLTFHEPVQTLQRQLLTFPEDLEDFFYQMLKSIPSAFQHRAAATLKVATEAYGPSLLLFYHFLDELIQGVAPNLDCTPTPLASHDLISICEKMQRQVNGRFRGLLEVTTEDPVPSQHFAFRVDFLHRTVRDFLVSSSKAADFFHANIGSDADLSIVSTKAAVAQIKFVKLTTKDEKNFGELLGQLFFHTRHAANLSGTTTTLDDILDTAEELCVAVVQTFPSRKSPFCFAGLAAQSGHTSFLERKFKMGLSLTAVRDFGGELPAFSKPILDSRDSLPKTQLKTLISSFAHLPRKRWKKPRQVDNMRPPLLLYALTPIQFPRQISPCLTTVELLISKGASPNEKYHDTTVWEQFLLSLNVQHEGTIRKEFLEIAKVLLRRGAPMSYNVSSTQFPIDIWLPGPGRRKAGRRRPGAVDKEKHTARELFSRYFTLDEMNQLVPSRTGIFG